ncbi:MAG: hypothetical protein JWO60_639 [Frankiales bacterium]|nr:hypothetical protein [Frankiales bacterium]
MSISSWLRDLDADAFSGRLLRRAAVVVPAAVSVGLVVGVVVGYGAGMLTVGPLFGVSDYGAAVYPAGVALLGGALGCGAGFGVAWRWTRHSR